MKRPSRHRMQLLVASLLLLSAVFLPWYTYVTMPDGEPIYHVATPLTLIWDTVWETPITLYGWTFAVPSILYLLAALAVGASCAVLFIGAANYREAQGFTWLGYVGAILALLLGLAWAPIVFVGLQLSDGFLISVRFSVSSPMAIVGSIFALLALVKLEPSGRDVP